MKKILLIFASMFALGGMAQNVASPDGKIVVNVKNEKGQATYSVDYEGQPMLTSSRLGLKTRYADFTKGIKLVKATDAKTIDKQYSMTRTKAENISYKANTADFMFEDASGNRMTVTFNVADNSVAFRYSLDRPKKGTPLNDMILSEATSFNFPAQTTTFLCPQSKPGWGFAHSAPSYETEYATDAPLTAKSANGVGFTFPALFHVGTDRWALVSETGVTSEYCASRLGDYNPEYGFPLLFPQEGENNGFGDVSPIVMLPFKTPWRTIALGNGLKPVVESTVHFDVVEPLYEAKHEYKPGRYTWSWLIWQDMATNYDDQVKFINLASEMGYEYCLVDAVWDTQIGYKRMEELSRYAQSKGVNLLLWYNSNGYANDAPQGPLGVMCNSIRRKKEMAWMQRNGIKGIKVDFFGGDKQATMKLYEDILSDANDYGLQVIFHGCTIPRGWERMYPNFTASEAALASENVYFSEYHAKKEGFELCMYPFTRNVIGSFDWGGVILNKYLSRDNKSRHKRYTTDMFELATAITNQCSVNCVELTPNGKEEVSPLVLDLAREIPTTWQETRFIDGYPGKYFVVARKHGGEWYVAGINGSDKAVTLNLSLPMFKGKKVSYYANEKQLKTLSVDKKGMAKVKLLPMDGFILK